MEGWGVLEIMKKLKTYGVNVTRVTHDKDSSTFNSVLSVFEDVAETYCTSMCYVFVSIDGENKCIHSC